MPVLYRQQVCSLQHWLRNWPRLPLSVSIGLAGRKCMTEPRSCRLSDHRDSVPVRSCVQQSLQGDAVRLDSKAPPRQSV